MTRTSSLLKTTLVSGLLALACVSGALAQTQPAKPAAPASDSNEDKTVVVVNGYEIKASELRMAFDDTLPQLANIPPNMRYSAIVKLLMERHLIAQLAASQGVADTDEYKLRLRAYQAKVLHDAYVISKIAPSVTDAEVKERFDKEAAIVQQTESVRARHILVATEKEANDIEAKLKSGAKFEDLAKQYSLDNTKDYGGDLGYFTKPEMVPEFANAAFALKVGEVSAPIKTQFGWHVIRLDDRKMGAAPPFDQVKGAIKGVLVQEHEAKLATQQLEAAKIDFKDPDLKAQYEDMLKRLKDKETKGALTQGQPDDSGKGDLSVTKKK